MGPSTKRFGSAGGLSMARRRPENSSLPKNVLKSKFLNKIWQRERRTNFDVYFQLANPQV